MTQKAFALDNFVINDDEDLDTGTIITAFQNSIGLPQVRGKLTDIYGRWPTVSAIDRRRGQRYVLESMFLEGTDALRTTKRLALIAALNPTLEETSRLVVADNVAPSSLLAAFGPWDIYNSGSTWLVRDVLRDAIGTLTGAIYFEDGPESRQQAIGVLPTTENLATNPSVETATTGYAALPNSTMTRSTDQAKYGNYSLELVTDAVAAGEGVSHSQTGLTATETYTFSVWVMAPSGATMRMRVTDSVDQTDTDFTGTGAWQRVITVHTMAAAQTTATTYIYTNTSAQAITFYVDALQVEHTNYPTTYCDGDQHGCAWSGTIHASTTDRTATQFNLDDYASLISDVSTLSFRFVVKMPLDFDADWPAHNPRIMYVYDSSTSGTIIVSYLHGTNEWKVYISGGNRLAVTGTFSAGDWVEIVVTIDFTNDSYALYIDGTQVDTDTTSLDAQTITEWNLGSKYNNTEHGDFIYSEFDVWDRVLTAAEVSQMNTNGTAAGRARLVDTICERADPLRIRGKPIDRGIMSRLIASGDVRWRSRDGDFNSFLASGNTLTMPVTVDSDDEVYPVIRIEPQDTKTGGFGYKQFQALIWKAPQGAIKYPTLIISSWDTASLTPAKMQADGDDLRVYVDGVEIERWLVDMDTADTDVWGNFNWKPAITLTSAGDIGAGEAATTLTVNESIIKMPKRGILMIGTEYFVYTGKNNREKQFTGVTRAAHGSSAGAHSTDDPVIWLQHEVYLMYGNSSLSAPTVDNDNKPMFTLASSTNDSWVYADFGDSSLKRAARWLSQIVQTKLSTEDPEFYTAAQYTNADPYEAVGVYAPSYLSWGRWYLYNPCGMTNANFTSGNKKYTTDDYWAGRIVSSVDGTFWIGEYTIPEPAATGGWEAWNRSQALDTGSVYVGLQIGAALYRVTESWVDAGACTVTLNTTYTPDITDGVEQANYELDVTIDNSTTGESISVSFQMAEDQVLEIDTVNKTVTYLLDGSRQTQALTTVEGARRDWLRLLSGLNTLTWTDTGTVQVEINIYYSRRYFE